MRRAGTSHEVYVRALFVRYTFRREYNVLHFVCVIEDTYIHDIVRIVELSFTLSISFNNK